LGDPDAQDLSRTVAAAARLRACASASQGPEEGPHILSQQLQLLQSSKVTTAGHLGTALDVEGQLTLFSGWLADFFRQDRHSRRYTNPLTLLLSYRQLTTSITRRVL
jgi:hypothetical protein